MENIRCVFVIGRCSFLFSCGMPAVGEFGMHDVEIIEVTLTDPAFGGEMLGRLPDGRVAFVAFTLPGERVRARVVETRRNFVRAELLEVLEPSADRIAPRCRHFGICGGCHYQNMPYSRQLEIKMKILRDQLARIGGLDQIPMQPIVPSPDPWNYRNSLQFHLTPEGKLGFQQARSNQVVPIQECHLPVEVIDQVWPLLEIEPLPGLARVDLRAGSDEEVLLALEGDQPELVEFSVEDLPISAVLLGSGGSLVLAGNDRIEFDILDRHFQVSAGSFFQVNTPQAGAMVQRLLADLSLTPAMTLLDVYCGVGLFSAFLAPHVERLVGIELDPSACRDFEVNLDEFDHVALYEAPAEDVLNNQDFNPQVILVDPPRAGLSPLALDGVVAQNAPTIAYISCDPSTLGRDARRLVKAGYRLKQITPFDLFPQTFHIESISLWSREI